MDHTILGVLSFMTAVITARKETVLPPVVVTWALDPWLRLLASLAVILTPLPNTISLAIVVLWSAIIADARIFSSS
jgi:hypothetical protein